MLTGEKNSASLANTLSFAMGRSCNKNAPLIVWIVWTVRLDRQLVYKIQLKLIYYKNKEDTYALLGF